VIPVVFDCDVLLAAIGWHGTPWRCVMLTARRHISLCVTEEILAEYDAIIPKRLREANLDVDPKPKLAWVRDVSKKV